MRDIAARHKALVIEVSMILQVCRRTAADKKGGHLAVNRTTGRLLLREVIPLCSAFDVAMILRFIWRCYWCVLCLILQPSCVVC